MRQIRKRFALLTCWLVLFCGIEYFIAPNIITAISGTVASAAALLCLLSPGLSQKSPWPILGITLFAFLITKIITRIDLVSANALYTTIEVCAVAATALLVRWVSLSIGEVETSIEHITLGRLEHQPQRSADGYGLIYREVKHARNYQRPLTLMAVAIDEQSVHLSLDRIAQQAQAALLKQYALARVSKTLCKELDEYHIVLRDNDHFLIGLPEVMPDQLPSLTEHLRRLVSEDIGLVLKIGAASLPQDGLTFEGLVDLATEDMESDLSSRSVTTANVQQPIVRSLNDQEAARWNS